MLKLIISLVIIKVSKCDFRNHKDAEENKDKFLYWASNEHNEVIVERDSWEDIEDIESCCK